MIQRVIFFCLILENSNEITLIFNGFFKAEIIELSCEQWVRKSRESCYLVE